MKASFAALALGFAGALGIARTAAATPAALYEWLDDRGDVRISEVVPDQYRSIAKRTDCLSWRKRFAVSRNCFAGFTLADGSLRPGAAQSCGPDLPNPEPVCGPEHWN